MRATRTILTWSVAAAFGAVGGFPATAAAQQAQAQLATKNQLECQAWPAQGYQTVRTVTKPLIAEARSIVPTGQYVWARWTIYRAETKVFYPEQFVSVQTSNWWRGFALPNATQPVIWTEWATNPYTHVFGPTTRQSYVNPDWQIPLVLNNIATRYHATVEFAWEPSPVYGGSWQYKTVWATNGNLIGACNWPLPHSY